MTEAADALGRSREESQITRSTDSVRGGGTEVLDQQARDDVARVEGIQEKHEAVCSERWSESRRGLQRVEDGLAELRKAVTTKNEVFERAMNERIGRLPASVIAALTGLVGFLAERAFHL